jgi:hypothetical protein
MHPKKPTPAAAMEGEWDMKKRFFDILQCGQIDRERLVYRF